MLKCKQYLFKFLFMYTQILHLLFERQKIIITTHKSSSI